MEWFQEEEIKWYFTLHSSGELALYCCGPCSQHQSMTGMTGLGTLESPRRTPGAERKFPHTSSYLHQYQLYEML